MSYIFFGKKIKDESLDIKEENSEDIIENDEDITESYEEKVLLEEQSRTHWVAFSGVLRGFRVRVCFSGSTPALRAVAASRRFAPRVSHRKYL